MQKNVCKAFLQNTVTRVSFLRQTLHLICCANRVFIVLYKIMSTSRLPLPSTLACFVSKGSFGRQFACTGGRLVVVLQ